MIEKLHYNSSMPRSGSELIQVILSQNPRVYASSTSPLLEFQYAARGNLTLPEVKSQDAKLMENAFISMCEGMAKSYYEPITDKPIIIDKNRGWSHYYEWVEQWNENPKMICMVRDLRSILASMERIYRKNRHLPDSIDIPAKIQNMTVTQRIDYWLNTQPIGLALARTLDTFQRNINDKILFVRYEDLLKNPQETLNKIYEYLGEEVFEHNFENIQKTVIEDHSHFGIFGNHSVKRKLGEFKENDWADIYDREVSKRIIQSNEWYFNVFGY
jgi:sulfotransferase